MKEIVNFEFIQKVLNEKYTGTVLEKSAFCGDIMGVAEQLQTLGYDRGKAGTVMELIRSGLSQEEALLNIKKG